MRKILVIEGDEATTLDETEFIEEGKLQDYLEEYPNVIPLSEIVEGASDLVCIGREVGAGSGSIDLLCIDKDGLLTIIETKLRKNREARREVIGQIVEYASYVSQWAADDVFRIANEYFLKSDKVLSEYEGSTLYTVVKEIGGDEYSEDDFRANIEQNLKQGRIRLIIAVDKLIEPLRAIVTYLNSHSDFDILLLQVSSFEQSESKKVLVPLLFGYAPPPPGRGIQRRRWDESSFLDNARERCKPEVASVITKLHDFARTKADNISWGTGALVGSFTFRKSRHGILTSIFTIQSDGHMYFNFGEMKGKQVKEEVIRSFRANLNEIQGINIPEEAISIGKFPSTTVEVLIQADSMKRFQDAVLELCRQIES